MFFIKPKNGYLTMESMILDISNFVFFYPSIVFVFLLSFLPSFLPSLPPSLLPSLSQPLTPPFLQSILTYSCMKKGPLFLYLLYSLTYGLGTRFMDLTVYHKL